MINEEKPPLTGLRVRVQTPNGEHYGLARVRYGDGHQHAGHYEVEVVGSEPLLVRFEDAVPGPNADQITLDVEFPDYGTFYTPRFLDETRLKYAFGRLLNLTGDAEALEELIAQVEPGWFVNTINHDYIRSSGVSVVTRNDGIEMREREISGAKNPKYLIWPVTGDDFEVNGNVLRIYQRYHGYTGGRTIILTMTFSPPSQTER